MAKLGDLKSTLNLPRTDFPMKAKLPEREPEQLAEWERTGLYQRLLERRAGAPLFVLHDGPPYPTGDIHLGTGLNKILKDMMVKSRTMAGFQSPYIPGWDCHGLPIETKVEVELGGKKSSVTPAEFRRRCREFAGHYVEQNRRDFKRLGIFGRWEKPYLTMDPHHEASIAGAFLAFLEKGYVYRGLKPVYWCLHDRTALAEAEVEYENDTSPSLWVRYPVVELPGQPSNRRTGFYALIWTTTPWTLPASMALAFHPNFDYVFATDEKDDTYIVAEQLMENVAKETGLRFTGVRAGPFRGAIFAKAKFQHPFLDRIVPGVLGKHVTLEQGTGIVHTAPGHGAEDFLVGQEYGIETYAPLDDDGRFVEGLPEYKGKKVFEANPIIIDLLRSRGALAGEGKLQHSYPHCWRCHQPVIFRATEQWFISMEHAGLRQRALEEIEKVKWTPAWGRQRIHEMVAERPDWCISRQRFWGVPLIIFYCGKCNARLEDYAALRNVLGFFEKEGADAWYTHTAAELLPQGLRCAKCGAADWRKEDDILDVWFDSGSTHLAVLSPEEKTWPADVYLEGPDQYRGWFQSSLLIGVGVRDKAPYKQVVSHGWTLDAKGEPMSKSRGNFVSPRDVTDKWGADLVRLWVASQDYYGEAHFSDALMVQLGEVYRKLRNTFRYALQNLYDFDPARDAVAGAELWELDAWMLRRTGELVRKCRGWYDEFEFHRVFHALHDFAVVDLSAFYFDILKDRLYTFAPRSAGRRSAQTAIYRIAGVLVRLLAPVLAFTTEEVWRYLPHTAGEPESIHMADFPSAEELENVLDGKRASDWERMLVLREETLKALEEARMAKTISAALEARVTIQANGNWMPLIERYAQWLPALFIVSQVEARSSPNAGPESGLSVGVSRAEGAKCERCWNYSTQVGASADYPTVCERCVAALEEIARDSGSAAGSAGS